jgi:hypothetical protein
MATSSQIPGGWYGLTEGPPIFSTSRPDVNNAPSRRTSPSMRKRGPRDRQPVSSIAGELLGRNRRGLTIDRGSDEQPVKPFHIPTGFAELNRQPVEQFGMRGTIAHDAKITGGIDQATAEHFLPHAIDGDARHQRVIGREQPLRESAAVERGARRQRRQHVRQRGTDALLSGVVITTLQNVGVGRTRFFQCDQRGRAVLRQRVERGVVRGNSRGQRARGLILLAEVETVDGDEGLVGGEFFGSDCRATISAAISS